MNLGPVANTLGACLLSAFGLALQSRTLRTDDLAAANKHTARGQWVLGFFCTVLGFTITADAMRYLSPSTIAVG